MDIQEKYHNLVQYLKPFESVVVAFSGGLDSTLVLKASVDAGLKVLAVTGESPALPSWDRENAVKTARSLGVRHIFVRTDEMTREGYRENSPERCFYCKDSLFRTLKKIAETEGYRYILDGTNADDLSDWRPGLKAAKAHGVLSPLAEVSINKRQVRMILRWLGIEHSERPSSACLASRLPYGVKVTEEALQMIARAEEALRSLGFSSCRVRHFGRVAIIEVPEDEIERILDKNIRDRVVNVLMTAGYRIVSVDLEGLRSGKMNRLLEPQSQEGLF